MGSIHCNSPEILGVMEQVEYLRGRQVSSILGCFMNNTLYFLVQLFDDDGDEIEEFYECELRAVDAITEFIAKGVPTNSSVFSMEPGSFVTSLVEFEYKSLDFLIHLLNNSSLCDPFSIP